LVSINLYRQKKSKLKLTTVLFLIAVLLLPVIALRITIETIKQNNLAEIRSRYQHSRKFIGDEDIKSIIKVIGNENIKTLNRTNSIKAETERIKGDLVYAGLSSDFINELGFQYSVYADTEKIFIDTITIERGKDFFLKYYDVSDEYPVEHRFAKSLKNAYKKSGVKIEEKSLKIDFMLVNILQEELTAKTSKY